MGHIEMGNAFIAAINAQQWGTAANYLADDLTWTGGTAGTLGKQGFLAAQQAWFAAVPNYHVASQNQREDGNTVHSTTTVSGTQTKPLALPGMPQIPATGKPFSVSFPQTKVTWRGDKITTIDMGESSKPTILEQLGVQLPG